jgi:uncharacterized protein (DUF697 family)
MTETAAAEGSASQLASYLLDKGLTGLGPLASAASLANEYLGDQRYGDDDARVAALVRWEIAKNFSTGFLTGLGGFVTLPVAVPSAIAASWVLQARMAGAIAHIYGHDLASERVRTKVLLSLAGDVARDAMRDLGLKPGSKLTQRAVDQIPGRALVEINKRIGARLLASAGQRVILKFPRAIPLVGGVVGGSLDAMVCHKVARTAGTLFRPPSGAVIDGAGRVVPLSATSES